MLVAELVCDHLAHEKAAAGLDALREHDDGELLAHRVSQLVAYGSQMRGGRGEHHGVCTLCRDGQVRGGRDVCGQLDVCEVAGVAMSLVYCLGAFGAMTPEHDLVGVLSNERAHGRSPRTGAYDGDARHLDPPTDGSSGMGLSPFLWNEKGFS